MQAPPRDYVWNRTWHGRKMHVTTWMGKDRRTALCGFRPGDNSFWTDDQDIQRPLCDACGLLWEQGAQF